MKFLQISLLATGALAVAGCTIHPIPDNVTGDTTLVIVRKVRCETRQAIKSELVHVLESTEVGTGLAKGKKFDQSINKYKSNPKLLTGGGDAKSAERYLNTAIAFKFRFNITENDNKKVGSGFVDSFSRGIFTLGVGVGNERQRLNERIFTITDTFGELLTELDDTDCDAHKLIGTNWIYPIAGRTGMDETIRTFFALDDESDFDTQGNTFVDRRAFQTRFFVNAEPTLTFTAIGLDVRGRITDVGLSSLSDRTDIHEVQVSIVASNPAPGENKTAAIENIDRENSLSNGRDLLDALRRPR